MRQVVFTIPLGWLQEGWEIPVYGYGLMLFLAYIFCTALARRLCRREGIDDKLIPDLTLSLFVTGIVGGRINFVIQYWRTMPKNHGFDQRPLIDVIKLWDGGLVLYGAIAGAMVGYFAYDYFVMRKHGVSKWKMLDVVAPCIALGIALGRIGCLFTGCCYGDVACGGRPIHFPLYSNTKPPQLTGPAAKMIERGYQTPLRFVLKEGSPMVAGVETGSPAEEAGLRAGDLIVKVNGKPYTPGVDPIVPVDGELVLTVLRIGEGPVTITYAPTTIGVNPTQIYETISMSLLLFFLLSYLPYRRRDGELMVLLMFGYGVHRFLNEMLRTDTEPVAFGLTYSQNVSIGVLVAALVLAWIVYRRPADSPAPPAAAPALPPATNGLT